jgi:hypothetical protein
MTSILLAVLLLCGVSVGLTVLLHFAAKAMERRGCIRKRTEPRPELAEASAAMDEFRAALKDTAAYRLIIRFLDWLEKKLGGGRGPDA